MTVTNDIEPVRLNRFLAQLGVGSRRTCDELIAAGKVRIDGKRVHTPGIKVVPGTNSVEVDGIRLDKPARSLVLLLHKPTGVVSTVSDPEGRPTVIDMCKRFGKRKRLFPVGRLDINTTGALLVTNDGLLCYRLTHPRFGIPKSYLVRVRGGYSDTKLESMRKMAGVLDSPGPARGTRASVELVKRLDKVTILKITLVEGRKRQVRRMCEAVGLKVVKLKRTNFGPISIRNVPLGSVRPLTNKELERLRTTVSLGANANGD
jgi:23S rRNA pseudouridine2605 synthase